MPVVIKAFIFCLALGPITPAVYFAHNVEMQVLRPVRNNMFGCLSGFNVRCQLGPLTLDIPPDDVTWRKFLARSREMFNLWKAEGCLILFMYMHFPD